MDLALNNLQRLICHKNQQTKPNHLAYMQAYDLLQLSTLTLKANLQFYQINKITNTIN